MSQQNEKSQHFEKQDEEENANELGQPELNIATLQVKKALTKDNFVKYSRFKIH
jgi:hypothetical protein